MYFGTVTPAKQALNLRYCKFKLKQIKQQINFKKMNAGPVHITTT